MNLHAKILDVLNENPMLHYGGFGKRNGLYGMMNEAEFSEQRSLVTKNESQVDQCLRWISINCEKRKRKRGIESSTDSLTCETSSQDSRNL